MYKIMSNRCAYPEVHYESLESTILVEENVIWENQGPEDVEEQEIVDYANTADDTLTDTANDSYVTANGDNTQYFSILDSSNQTILNDIGDMTISNSIIQESDIEVSTHDENNCIDLNNGQVVLFKVDGSDDLYGFQLSRDDDGNLQKYQFKVRQGIEGNLEAVPETIQILPVENIINTEVTDETEQTSDETFHDAEDFEQIREKSSILVKEEQTMLHDANSVPEFNEEHIFEESLDTKDGILELTPTTATIQKHEIHEDLREDMESPNHVDSTQLIVEDYVDEEQEEEVFYTHEDDLNTDHFAYGGAIEEEPVGEEETPTSAEHYEELFVKESHLMDDATCIEEENGAEEAENVNESENEEDFEIIEGVHVTGDIEEPLYDHADIRKSPSYQSANLPRKRIIKNVIRKIRIQKNDDKGNLYYLVRNNTEKENLGGIPGNSLMKKPNPRSILKCSAGLVEPKKEEDEEKYDKRFAKSKEAQQARLFHNFIAQTKIIHAPVRQERLPRKQQIKPMERTDEEIVVQEVVVSSTGFIETSEEGVLKERVPLKPTEYIQLTDSDEDFDPKSPHKTKRKMRKRKPMVEITISDSEDSSSSDASLKEPDEEEVPDTPIKRARGRPPKQHEEIEERDEKETIKRPRGRPRKHPRPVEEEIIVIKIDNQCPKCPKSFPSEGSLRSHMQYHNFSELGSSNDAKYICEKCGDTFKNCFLLNRHMNSHKTSNINCGICKKVFVNQAQLLAHKKTHMKQHMLRNTTLARDSPKIARFSLRNRCDDCGKSFLNVAEVNEHKKLHKKIACRTCKSTFNSKFTFANHLRLNCVKGVSTERRRGGIVARQSALLPQTRKPEVVAPKIPANTAVITNIKCDSCSMTFATYTSLFKHKVLKHGLDTPEKFTNNRETGRKSLYRNRPAHSGIRPSAGLKNAFAGLQSKLEVLRNSQKKT